MRKGLLLLIVAGAFLVSCGANGEIEKEAAQEFCDCYREYAQTKKEAASQSARDMFSSIGKIKGLALKAQKCQKILDSKYKAKLDLDLFKEEVKKINATVYNLAVEEGSF